MALKDIVHPVQLETITHYARVLQAGWAFDFETILYIFISLYFLLNKHFISILTR